MDVSEMTRQFDIAEWEGMGGRSSDHAEFERQLDVVAGIMTEVPGGCWRLLGDERAYFPARRLLLRLGWRRRELGVILNPDYLVDGKVFYRVYVKSWWEMGPIWPIKVSGRPRVETIAELTPEDVVRSEVLLPILVASSAR